MKYKVGDTVVHLAHGVGEIKSIETREFRPGVEQSFYILGIFDNGAPKKVFVPVDASLKRLRPIISKTQAKQLLSSFDKDEENFVDHQTWNRRYREFMEKIHTGNIEEISQVVRILFRIKRDKDLSFGERKLFDQALTLLVTELAFALNKSKTYVESVLFSKLEAA